MQPNELISLFVHFRFEIKEILKNILKNEKKIKDVKNCLKHFFLKLFEIYQNQKKKEKNLVCLSTIRW